MRGRAAALGLAALALAVARAALAADPSTAPVSASLEWRADPDSRCMDQERLQRSVEERLRRPVFAADQAQADVVLSAELTRAAEGWLAVLELRTRDGRRFGRRVLPTRSAECSGLDDSLVLVVALLLDAPREKMEQEVGGPLGSPEPEPAKPEPPAPPPSKPPSTPRARDEAWRFSASVLAAGTLGRLPDPGYGLRLRFGVTPPKLFAVELEGTAWASAEAGEGEHGATLSLTTLGLYVCPLALGGGRLSAALCAGQDFGQLSAEGFGFDDNREQSQWVYDLSLRAGISVIVVGPASLRASMGAQAPLVRDRFFFTTADGRAQELFRVPVVVATADAGVGLDW